MRRWHTNKTKPVVLNNFEIIVIWKDKTVSIELLNYDDYGRIFISGDTWKEIKKDIKYWQYVDKYFEKEFKETRKEINGG